MKKVLFLFLIVLTTCPLLAQNEDGVRNVPNLTDGPPFSAFHTHIPIIRSIPPLSLSMPLDVLFGYIAIDSICKFYNDSLFRIMRGHDLPSALRLLEPSNDTLHTVWKYLYKMMDYNPLIFRQYLSELCISQNAKYKYSFFYDVGTILQKSHMLEHQLSKRIASAIIPDYILKVQVVSIDSMKAPFTSYGGDTTNYNFFKISCKVLDTIKGKVIPMDTITFSESLKKIEELRSVSYRFNFVITENSYFQLRQGYSSTPHPFPIIDSITFDNSRQIMRVQQGQELLVFINSHDPLWSLTKDHFHFHTSQSSCNSGVMPIVNGMISDVNKVWSDSTWIPYSTFKERYNETVDIILQKRY